MTSGLSGLIDGSSNVLGRLAVVWTYDPRSESGTEYRCAAEGLADTDAQFVVSQLRKIADQLERQGWERFVVPKADNARPAWIDVDEGRKRLKG